MDNIAFATLSTFRADVYAACDRRRDSLFELTDALLTAGSVPSLPHLSVYPVQRSMPFWFARRRSRQQASPDILDSGLLLTRA
jgi:hypothetical protein